LAGLGHPSYFQRLLRLGFVTAATSLNESQPNFARCLAVSWAGRLFIHFRGLLLRNRILPGAKFTLCPLSLALSYIGSVAARHSSSGREPYFAALSTRRHLSSSFITPLYSAGRPSRWALAHIFKFFSVALTDTIRWTILTCAQKLTSRQLNLPHGTKQKKNNE